jgi:hypothetical protein
MNGLANVVPSPQTPLWSALKRHKEVDALIASVHWGRVSGGRLPHWATARRLTETCPQEWNHWPDWKQACRLAGRALGFAWFDRWVPAQHSLAKRLVDNGFDVVVRVAAPLNVCECTTYSPRRLRSDITRICCRHLQLSIG